MRCLFPGRYTTLCHGLQKLVSFKTSNCYQPCQNKSCTNETGFKVILVVDIIFQMQESCLLKDDDQMPIHKEIRRVIISTVRLPTEVLLLRKIWHWKSVCQHGDDG